VQLTQQGRGAKFEVIKTQLRSKEFDLYCPLKFMHRASIRFIATTQIEGISGRLLWLVLRNPLVGEFVRFLAS
jgi:hypothetical protein